MREIFDDAQFHENRGFVTSAFFLQFVETEANTVRGFPGPAQMEACLDGVFAARLESLKIPSAAAVVADGNVGKVSC